MALSNRSRRLANLPIILATPSTKSNVKKQISYEGGLFVLKQQKSTDQLEDFHQLPLEENQDLSKCNLQAKYDLDTLREFPLPISVGQLATTERRNKRVSTKNKQDVNKQLRKNSELVISKSFKPIVIHHTSPIRRISQHQAHILLNRQWKSISSSESILVYQSSALSTASDGQIKSDSASQEINLVTSGSSTQDHIQSDIMNLQNLPFYAIVAESSVEKIKNAIGKDKSAIERNNEIFVTKDPTKALSPTRTVRIKPDSDRLAIKKARLALFAQTARESLGGKSLVIPSIDSLKRLSVSKQKKQSEIPIKSINEPFMPAECIDYQSNRNFDADNVVKNEENSITTNDLNDSRNQSIIYKRKPFIKNELILSRLGTPKHTYQGPAKSLIKSQTIGSVQKHLKSDQVAVLQNGKSKLTVLKISESALRHIRESTNRSQPPDKIIPRSVRPVILPPDSVTPYKKEEAHSTESGSDGTTNHLVLSESDNSTICESYDAPILDTLDGPSALYNDGGDIENTSTISVTDLIPLE